MTFRIFVQDNCDFCKELSEFPSLNVEKVYINRDGFEGFRPANVPVLQHGSIQLEGPYQINDFLTCLEKAQQGEYEKK